MSEIKKHLRWFGIRFGIGVVIALSVLSAIAYSYVWYANNHGPVEYVEVVKEVTPAHDIPQILKYIAECESGDRNISDGKTSARQFKENGDVIRGKITPSDIGYLQINEPIWNDTARRMGIDIYTLEGNLAMGEYILNNFGTDAWSTSAKCWKK